MLNNSSTKKIHESGSKRPEQKTFDPQEIMRDSSLRQELKEFLLKIKREVENLNTKKDKDEWIRAIRSWGLKDERTTEHLLQSLTRSIDEYEKNEKRIKEKKVDMFSFMNRGKIIAGMLLEGKNIIKHLKEIQDFLTVKGVIQPEEIEKRREALG